MNAKSVKVFVPATVANVACGFDILGFALGAPGDELIATRVPTPGLRIKSITGDEGRLPLDADRNTASVAAQKFLAKIGQSFGIEIELKKCMPLGSGLGSSAASSVAGVFAANILAGEPLKREELVEFAMEGERVACGSAHADNVAPALLGGLVLIRSYSPLDLVRIPCPTPIHCAVVHPHLEIRTEDARKILRKDVPLKSAIIQWANTAGLVAGFMKGDIELIGRSLEDVIIEPERAILIPGFASIKSAALKAGALGCSISGSGPSIFALCRKEQDATTVGHAMVEAFAALNIGADLFTTPINQDGPRVLERH